MKRRISTAKRIVAVALAEYRHFDFRWDYQTGSDKNTGTCSGSYSGSYRKASGKIHLHGSPS